MKIILLVIALAARAEAPKAGFEPAAAASAAVAAVQSLVEIPGVRAVDPGRINVFPRPAETTGCSLSALLRTRFLSGPWSAARRLEAARLRGDLDEVRRMESALDALVDEATALNGP